MERSEYRQIADRAEAFFRTFRRVIIGLAALAVAVPLVLAIVFYAMGW